MLNFSTNIEKYSMDLLDEIKSFGQFLDGDYTVLHTMREAGSVVINEISINGRIYNYNTEILAADTNEFSRLRKRASKHSLYLAMKEYTGKALVWGSLTGVRPTKLAYEFLSEGGKLNGIVDYLVGTFDVSPCRAEIVQGIVKTQSKYLRRIDNKVNLYVHIPFCTSRCNYCSFPSVILRSGDTPLSPYIDKLIEEIVGTLELIKLQGKEVLSVYVGGGTPSVLPPSLLKKLLATLQNICGEFTFEAGRPDSLDSEKLQIISDFGVTRLCLNPQTLNNATLARIGRAHTCEQFFDTFELAAKYGFILNVDLIAGLENEKLADFERSLAGIISQNVDNITVHTLSRKRASDNAFKMLECNEIVEMADYARETLESNGYVPYYLYRQKYMLGGLENLGYSKPDRECLNNITVMEEVVSVYACGAGAISKIIDGNGDIHRYQNAKDVKLYVTEFDKRLAEKYKILSI